MKNFFSVAAGSRVLARPTIGRSAVVICKATSKKTIIQTRSPAYDRVLKWLNPELRNRRPKITATVQKTRCKAPMPATDLVDCENTHATGAKPISKTVIKASSPATRPNTSTNRACDPPRHEKIYRLGRQINAEMNSPATIFNGAAQICSSPEKVPTTIP